jgi:hypothetical protein
MECSYSVIASEAKQSRVLVEALDCFGAKARLAMTAVRYAALRVTPLFS